MYLLSCTRIDTKTYHTFQFMRIMGVLICHHSRIGLHGHSHPTFSQELRNRLSAAEEDHAVMSRQAGLLSLGLVLDSRHIHGDSFEFAEISMTFPIS